MRSELAFAVLLPLCLSAQSAPKPGSISGTLTNAATGAPVRDCAVIMTNQRGSFRYNAITDDGGRFLFASVEPDPAYQPAIACQGFTMPAPTRQTLRDMPPISVTEDQHVDNLSIKVVPLGAISGKVLDADNEPLRGVSIQLLQYHYVPAGRRLDIVDDATTDARGQYRLFFLKPGRYLMRAFLRVTPPGPPGAPGHVHSAIPDEGFLPLWYPGSPDSAQASLIDVKPAADLTAYNFRLPRTPVFHVRGTLVSSVPKRPAVEVFPCVNKLVDTNYGFAADSQPNGSFDARGVPPGQYCVSAPQSNFRQISADTEVVVANHDVEGIALTASDGSEVSGAMEVEGDPGYKLPKFGVRLQDSAANSCCSAISQTSEEGHFLLRKVPPGNYEFGYSKLPPDLYLKSLRQGDQELASDRLDIRNSVSPLSIVLATGTGKVSGIVQDTAGNPADYTQVTLAPKGGRAARSDLYYSAFTRNDGSFQVSDVAPGEYNVFAWEAPGVPDSPDFLKLFADRATSITVSPQNALPVQLKSISAQEIEEALWK